MTRLATAVLEPYAGQVEADLQRYYRVDLRDLWRTDGGRSRLTYRRLGALVDALPGDSAYKTAVRDSISDEDLVAMAKKPRDKHGTWSHTDLLLAKLIDLVGMQVHGLRLTGEFEATPRPGVLQAKKRRALSAEGYAYLMKIRLDHEREHGYGSGSEVV